MPLPASINPHETLALVSGMASVVAMGSALLVQVHRFTAIDRIEFPVAGPVRQPLPADHLQALAPFITTVLLAGFSFVLGGKLVLALGLGAVSSLDLLVPRMVPAGSLCVAIWTIGLGACGLYATTLFVGRHLGGGIAALIIARRQPAAASR